MRVALISDIHGCATALDAVLAEIDATSIDRLICLGDVAAGGPTPGPVIDRLAERSCPCVMGNTDEGLVELPDWWRDPATRGIPAEAHPGLECSVWAAETIDAAQREFVAGFPDTETFDLDHGVDLLAFHGSPRSNVDYVTAVTPVDELDDMLGGATQAVLAGGHTHVQLVRSLRGRTLLNVGSVGAPFDSYGIAGTVNVLGHAEYAVIETGASGSSIALRRVAVDPAAVVEEVARSEMPHRDWWLGLRGLGVR